MARKFLYIFAFLIVLVLAGLLALRVFADDLTRIAFVPTAKFVEQEALPANRYDDPAMWFSRPGMPLAQNPAMWLPEGVAPVGDAPGYSVFFIHPTSYLAREYWNAPLDDAESQDRAKLFIRGMATVFNATPDLWAPRYRQAAFGAFLTDQPEGAKAFDAAYRDVNQAFDAFLAAVPKDRPIVIAGHSQGSLHLVRLLKERIAGTPLQSRVIAAYAVGWPISIEHDLPSLGLPGCSTPDQSGCIMSWASYGPDGDPSQVTAVYDKSTGFDGKLREGSAMLCTNPLTGGAAPDATAEQNIGTLVPSDDLTTGAMTPKAVGAACDARGFLVLSQDVDLGPYVLPGNDYHVYDYPLFWANARADVARRVAAFTAAKAK